MQRGLRVIGVGDKKIARVLELQKQHIVEIKENEKKILKLRKNLADLQQGDATEEQLLQAVKKVSKAQEKQLRMFVMNRQKIKQILGKEKYTEFMAKARKFYQQRNKNKKPHFPGVLPERKKAPAPKAPAKNKGQK